MKILGQINMLHSITSVIFWLLLFQSYFIISVFGCYGNYTVQFDTACPIDVHLVIAILQICLKIIDSRGQTMILTGHKKHYELK